MISSVILFIVLLVAIVLQGFIARSLWRIRQRVRLNSSQDGFVTAPVSISVVIRLACFSLVTLFVIMWASSSFMEHVTMLRPCQCDGGALQLGE
jgi:hypothetical protein